MTAATWVIAAASLITALSSLGVQVRHGRRDLARFAEHGKRIRQLENGGTGDRPGGESGSS